jgi:Mrp family chromosome partitioning ATPase
VEEARQHYDLVIIDSPPLQAVSDPAVIASRIDGVLMTVRITKHGRAAILNAKQTLTRVGANIIGVVVNASDQTRGFGYGGGYNNGSYGYGYGEHESYHDRQTPALNLR